MRLKELPNLERPYEKLELYGEEKLTNSELLAIIIKTGTKEETAIQIAQRVLMLGNREEVVNLNFLQEISLQELMQIKGIGKVKAIQMKAVGEIAKRISKPIKNQKIMIRGTEDVANLLMSEMKQEKRELVKILILNHKNVLLKIKDISFGGTNYAVVDPKEVFVDAVKMQAQRVILVHNHPSGDPTPSVQDCDITKRLQAAAEILGIELIDHVIIGNNKYESVFSRLRNERKR